MGQSFVEEISATFAFTPLPSRCASSVSYAFEKSYVTTYMVDGSQGCGVVIAMSCLACEVRLSAIGIDASVFWQLPSVLPMASQVAAFMEEETVAFHHGKIKLV